MNLRKKIVSGGPGGGRDRRSNPGNVTVAYADDAAVVSQPLEQLRKMEVMIKSVCTAFGLSVSEARPKTPPALRCTQGHDFLYLVGNVNQDANMSIEVYRPMHNAYRNVRMYILGLYDRPSVPLELKSRMLKAEVV